MPEKSDHSFRWTFALLAAGLVALVAILVGQFFSPEEPGTPKEKPKTAQIDRAGESSGASQPSTTQPSQPPPPAIAGTQATPAPASGIEAVASPPASANAHAGEYAQPPAVLGERATAKVKIDGRDIQLAPNQIGNFQRVHVAPAATTPVEVNYAKASAGDVVVVEAQDGGTVVESKQIAHIGKIDDARNLAFNFKVSELPGTHRVLLRKGADVKQLDFWVGPPLPVATNR